MICERCSNEIYKYDVCNYCNRKVCFSCVKSQKKISPTERAYICKDCWSNLKRRKKYKSYMVVKAVFVPRTQEGRRY